MRNGFCLLPLALACASAPLSGSDAEPAPLLKLRAVPFTQVRIRDSFWAARQETNRVAAIAINLAMLEKAGNIHNFELAAAGATNGYSGPVFMDSDLYKGLDRWLTRWPSVPMRLEPAPGWHHFQDCGGATVGRLSRYLLHRQGARGSGGLICGIATSCIARGICSRRRWRINRPTGKRAFLDVAVKLADHIDSVFGPGKRLGYPGHPEIELALIKLWRATAGAALFQPGAVFHRKPRAPLFCRRTHTPLDRYDGSYWQDDVPIVEHQRIKGHACGPRT